MAEYVSITYKQKKYLGYLIAQAKKNKNSSFQDNLDINELSVGEASALITELLEDRGTSPYSSKNHDTCTSCHGFYHKRELSEGICSLCDTDPNDVFESWEEAFEDLDKDINPEFTTDLSPGELK